MGIDQKQAAGKLLVAFQTPSENTCFVFHAFHGGVKLFIVI
jgi:hypothetical protein